MWLLTIWFKWCIIYNIGSRRCGEVVFLGKPNKQTKKRLDRIKGVETVCKSLVKNEIIEKLRDSHRYERFLAIVQLCSEKNMSLENTVSTIKSAFGGYINENELTVKIFKNIIETELDVAEAWGYGTNGSEISNLMIKKKAVQLALAADDISVIKTYNEIYGQDGIASGHSSNGGGTIVRLNISK